MRAAAVAFGVALLLTGTAGASDAPLNAAYSKVRAALEAEKRVGSLPDSPADHHFIESAARSLDDALKQLKGMPRSAAADDIRFARDEDREMAADIFARRGDPADRRRRLDITIAAKEEAMRRLLDAVQTFDGEKATPSTPTPAPKCTRHLTARRVAGCVGISFWDINVDHDAKRVACSFRGPAGELSVARPLFPRTFQTTDCKLTKTFRVVDGVRKRIVHAELRITVPEGQTVAGTRPVRVTAFWK